VDNSGFGCLENVIDIIKINLTAKASLLIALRNPIADIRLARRNNL
jgi:hypothetical protein